MYFKGSFIEVHINRCYIKNNNAYKDGALFVETLSGQPIQLLINDSDFEGEGISIQETLLQIGRSKFSGTSWLGAAYIQATKHSIVNIINSIYFFRSVC